MVMPVIRVEEEPAGAAVEGNVEGKAKEEGAAAEGGDDGGDKK